MDNEKEECPWICSNRRESYSVWNLIFELITILITFIVGIYGLYWFPGWGLFIALFYGLWCFICYFVVFRIVLCPNCYYYGRWCPDGMGKYAKKVFGVKGSVMKYKKALIIPTIGWAVIFFFPILFMILYYIFIPELMIPFLICNNLYLIPVLLYCCMFGLCILGYFILHIRFSCRGCAHRNTCNLLKAFSFLKPLSAYKKARSTKDKS
jgi:hypothetical protein